MDGFPLNLILAVATAAATIFLGFLPTKSISSTLFARQTSIAIFAWALIAFTTSTQIIHYLLTLTFFCFASWWNFRRDHALAGKMWLSLASGLGISMGVMLILEITPRAYPKGLPQLNDVLLLASIYLGGAVIGLAYTCFALIQGTRSGVTQGVIQRYVALLFWLALARAAVLLASAFFSPDFGMKPPPPNLGLEYLLSGAAILIMPILAFLSQRAARFSSQIQPTQYLIAIISLGFLIEIGARLFVL